MVIIFINKITKFDINYSCIFYIFYAPATNLSYRFFVKRNKIFSLVLNTND